MSTTLGHLLSLLGTCFVLLPLTLVRYHYIDGNSTHFALLYTIGSLLLIASTYWLFHVGVIIVNVVCTITCLHTSYLNRRQATQTKDVA